MDAVVRARSFPRAADWRDDEDRGDGEVLRVGGTEQAKVTASKASD